MVIGIQTPNGLDQNDIVEKGRLRQMPNDLMKIKVIEVWQSDLAALGKTISLERNSVGTLISDAVADGIL
jgi:hypothetical protein